MIGFPLSFTSSISVFFIFSILVFHGFDLSAEENPTTRILIVHSYHPTFSWTKRVHDGMLSVFTEDQEQNLSVEYIDIKQKPQRQHKEYLQEYEKFFIYKHRDKHYDLILCSDDTAIQFILSIRDQLFPGVPVVFCGMNLYLPIQEFEKYFAKYSNVTGVCESADFRGSTEMALRLFPHPRQVAIVHNGDNNSLYYLNRLTTLIGIQCPIVELRKKKGDEILAFLREGSKEDLIFFLSIPNDWNQSLEKNPQALRNCPAPIFTFWGQFVGKGILGGRIVNPYKQGAYAADMAMRIIQGETADSIPIQWDSPNDYVFDCGIMQKFGLKESDLPEGSVLVNKPFSFYNQYFTWIWGGIFFIVIQSIFLIYLGFNLSRRKKAESSLRISEERLSLALNAANEGLWDYNPQTLKVHYFSPKWYTMIGYEPYEFEPSYEVFRKYVHPDDLLKTEKKVLDSIEAGRDYSVEFRMRSKQNGYRWILSRGKIVERDSFGYPTRMVGTHVDITEQKNLEEHLRQSQKMESIGLLAGGIAHDFNNLMTAVIGYSELLLNRIEESHPMYHSLHEIRKAGERATTLTRQLLAYGRKQMLSPRIINLNHLIVNMDAMLRRLIGENIDYRTVPDSELGYIEADPGQIEQVVMNLALNSRDAMPDGGQLTIETKNVYLDESYIQNHMDVVVGDYVMLAVSDTGCGIEEENLKKIFDPFFTTKEKGKGTGLGLSMVYGIVKQSGGHIFVYSEPGFGTTFKLYFPRSMNAASEEKTRDVPFRSYKGEEHVLLVEDDSSVRDLVAGVLRANSYTVHEFGCGPDALLFLESYRVPIHLLITDVILPQMSGAELAKRISLQDPRIETLFISGYTDNAIVHKGMFGKDVHFLQKPFTPHEILKMIRDILDR